jgi:hypothetical protein
MTVRPMRPSPRTLASPSHAGATPAACNRASAAATRIRFGAVSMAVGESAGSAGLGMLDTAWVYLQLASPTITDRKQP